MAAGDTAAKLNSIAVGDVSDSASFGVMTCIFGASFSGANLGVKGGNALFEASISWGVTKGSVVAGADSAHTRSVENIRRYLIGRFISRW